MTSEQEVEASLEAVLTSMNAALGHRGPDDTGLFSDRGIGLAMSRLAIIDLAGGHQPMFSDDRNLVVVFNGEIYNHRELRAELGAAGYRFRTDSDTEVLVHGYAEWREELLPRLKGMFAFCVLDRRRDELFLARDRFGEKPLFYWGDDHGRFAFSSELRSLLQWSVIERRADHEALGYYLRVGFIPAPLSGFRSVRSLEPGHWLRYRRGRLSSAAYYHPDYRPDPSLDDEGVATEAVRAALRRAVARQAMADVPLGAFLSGGIDSSSIVAMLQEVSNSPVKTFTIQFREASYDESSIARETASHLGTEHRTITIDNLAFDAEHLWRIVDHAGMPFYDSSAIPTYVLSREVRRHVKVALSGDGGDELFAGYPFFRWGLTLRGVAESLPASSLHLGARAARWLGSRPELSGVTALRRARRALEAAAAPHLPVAILSIFDPDQLAALLDAPEVLEGAVGPMVHLTETPPEAADWTPLRRLMYYRLKNNLPGDMLTKVDRMSMACSLEVRAPMLDPDLADLSMRLPDKHLLRRAHGRDIIRDALATGRLAGQLRRRGKHVLRAAMRPVLPVSVFRQKSGFCIPLHHYQNQVYRQLVDDLLLGSQRLRPLFHRDELDAIVDRGLTLKRDRADTSVYRSSHQLWSLLVLAAWAERFEVGF